MKSLKKVLEIGCGDGCNLYPYHLLGKQVKGYDYGEEFLESGRRRGMDLVNGNFANDNDGPYDLILVIHSFEHLLELDQFVQQVLPLLAKDGRIYVEVPGIRNWNLKQNMVKKEDGFESSNNFLLYLQYQHNYHFDLSHLMEFWQRNGFEMIQGDEWVRALIKKGKPRDSISLNKDILSHLHAVEKDHLSPKNLVKKITRKILRTLKVQ